LRKQENSKEENSKMSISESALKTIPLMKSGITAQEYSQKEPALEAALSLRNCDHFYKDVKDISLPLVAKGMDISVTPSVPIVLSADQEVAVKLHKNAVLILTLSFVDNATLISWIIESRSEAWPNGEMWMIVDKINKRLKKTGTGIDLQQGRIDKKKAMDAITMGPNDSPSLLFEKIAALKVQYMNTPLSITDQDCIDALYEKMPQLYVMPMTIAQSIQEVSHPGIPISYDAMQNQVIDFWERINSRQTTDNELSLATGEHPVRDDGVIKARWSCYYCGKDGHIKRKCRQYNAEKDELYCSHCMTAGHDDDSCLKLHKELYKIKGGVRQRNKFGKAEAANGTTSTANTTEQLNANVDMELSCLML
jgi:hypothetical protein